MNSRYRELKGEDSRSAFAAPSKKKTQKNAKKQEKGKKLKSESRLAMKA